MFCCIIVDNADEDADDILSDDDDDELSDDEGPVPDEVIKVSSC